VERQEPTQGAGWPNRGGCRWYGRTAYQVTRFAHRTGRLAHRTLIVGARGIGPTLAAALADHPEYGLQPIGFLDDDDGATAGFPLLGTADQLAGVLQEFDVRHVIVASGSMPEADLVGVIRTCDRMNCEIFLVPRLSEMPGGGPGVEPVWAIPLVRLRRSVYRTAGRSVKRAADLGFSLVALPLLSPVFAVVALAVRLETGPGVVFGQERVGVDGRHFRLLTFRSITPISAAESATTWSVGGDARLGGVGRFLRRTSLDELPQLVNVLRGDMSLVGPRPERPQFVSARSASGIRITRPGTGFRVA
jgi:Bacterial sugar transferase/CoA-binding domain